MCPALNIPALISPPCPSLPHTLPSATAKQWHERYRLPLMVLSQYITFYRFPPPFRSLLCCLPLPFPFPLPILSHLPIPSWIFCSIPFPRPFLTTGCVLHILALVIDIALGMTAPSTAWPSGIHPVLIIITILVDHLIPISGLTARMPPGLYCQQLGGSIFALRSSLPYHEKRSQVRLTFPSLVVWWLERLAWSPKARGLSHLQLFIWLRVLSNICPIFERNAAHHSRNGELLLLWSGHIWWNCEKWQVVTGSKKNISWMRAHALSSVTTQTLQNHMSSIMCSKMNLWIRSRSNDCHHFITDVGIFALAVTFPFPLWIRFGAIAVSWKWISVRGVRIIILLHVVEGCGEGTYKVV